MGFARACLAGLAVVAVSGCMTNPEKAMVARQPSTAPARTLSNFSEALRCMDNLLWTHGKRDIYLTSNGIPDETGRLRMVFASPVEHHGTGAEAPAVVGAVVPTSSTPSTIFMIRSTSPPKSAWPGVSTMLIR